MAAPHILLRNPPDTPVRGMLGIVELDASLIPPWMDTLPGIDTDEERLDSRWRRARRGFERQAGGEDAVIVWTEDVSEGFRARFCERCGLYPYAGTGRRMNGFLLEACSIVSSRTGTSSSWDCGWNTCAEFSSSEHSLSELIHPDDDDELPESSTSDPISEDEDDERESTLTALYIGGGTAADLVEWCVADESLSDLRTADGGDEEEVGVGGAYEDRVGSSGGVGGI